LVVAGGGGPGVALGISQTAWENADNPLWTSWSKSTVDAGRDLILIDNRGVGSAEPRLDCHEIEEAAMSLLDKKLERMDLIALIGESYSACKHRLEKQGIALSQYHIVNSANDLEQLRIALDVEKFNIYGASYSSRVALVYERLYPEVTRTLILDGIFPQSIKTYENEPRRNYQAVMRVFDKCNRNILCYGRYGSDLDRRLTVFLNKLDTSPISIEVSSDDDKKVNVEVTASMFFDSLYAAIYDPATIRRIPEYLYAIFSGNTQYLKKLIGDFYVTDISTGYIDEGAYASYACYDEIPFVDFSVARNELMKYPFQYYSNAKVFDHMQVMCEVWDVPAANAGFKDIYRIHTPLLIYSGELDPVTPAELARPVVENASIWWGKVWPDSSHEVMHQLECADRVAAVFLRDPVSNPFIYKCASDG
jgi:pimeloyl-ACP methyl ester carboxylesterase